MAHPHPSTLLTLILLSTLLLPTHTRQPLSPTDIIDIVEKANGSQEIIDRVAGQGDLQGYYRYDTFWKVKMLLEERYPQFVGQDMDFGKSLKNNPIRAFFVGLEPNDPDAQKSKSAILIDSSHHAREAVSFEMVLIIMLVEVNSLIKNRPESQIYKSTSLLIYPVVNVDGVIAINDNFALQKDRRKNLRDVGCGVNNPDNGVDINRNYDIKFDILPEVTLTKCGDEYRGAQPFSEPETAAVKHILDTYPSVSSALNLHCWGNLWIHPYNFLKPGESFEMNEIQPKLAKLYNDFKQTVTFPKGAVVGDARTCVGYSASGEASDWMALKRNIFAWSPELGSEKKSTDDFYISPEDQHSVITAQYPMMRQFIDKHNSLLTITVPLEVGKNMNSTTVIFQLNNIGYNRLYDLKPKVFLSKRGLQKFQNSDIKSVKIDYDTGSQMMDRLGHAFLLIEFSRPASYLDLKHFDISVELNGRNILKTIEEDELLESEHQVALLHSKQSRGTEGVVYVIAATLILVFCCSMHGPKIIRQRCKHRHARLPPPPSYGSNELTSKIDSRRPASDEI